jgi:Uma2 family endonuclease
MIQAGLTGLNVDEFIAQYRDRDQYELIDGELIDLEPTGLHEQVIGFMARKLNVEIDRVNLPYTIPHRCLVRISDDTTFCPDLNYIGTPKQPMLTVCHLEGDRYQKHLFRLNENLSSGIFPELRLQVGKIFAAGCLCPGKFEN